MTTLFDDRDASVTYAASADSLWAHGGVSSEYRSTTTSTNVKGATATLKFLGEVLQLFSAVEQQMN